MYVYSFCSTYNYVSILFINLDSVNKNRSLNDIKLIISGNDHDVVHFTFLLRDKLEQALM